MKTHFGKYELIEKIGTGGMAEVYLAKSYGAEGLQKTLVIKRILPELIENERFVEMFISEATIAVQLNHPNIVQIYDFGKANDDFYLAMEYVEGHDLSQIIEACRKAGKPLSIGEAVYIAIEVAKGLHYAHQRKDEYGEDMAIVHRDISPQNILISQDGTVKIVDFGIAKATSVAEDKPHVVKGKFRYMSPEQASGQPVDHRSDLFSLGVVLFELVCGRSLFRQTTRDETLSLVKSAVVPDITNLNPDVPAQLEHLLYKVLAREPGERHASARELQVELTRVLYSLGDIHDAMTLSAHITHVEEHAGADSTGEPDGAGHTALTNVLTPGGPTTANVGTELVREPTPIADSGHFDQPDADAVRILSRERKEVVVIAGEVLGLMELRSAASDQSRWLQVLHEYTRIVDSIAFKNEGVVHRVNENDFVIVLGIPVSSENDAERAVRVAMDLHEAVAGMSFSLDSALQLAIGAGVAEVLIERTGDQNRGDYQWSFFGTSQEVALRLAQSAMAKEVLLGGQVYRRVRRDYQCETVEPVEFEDKSGATQRLQPHRLIARKSQRAQLAELRDSYRTFRGRELSLRVLRNVYSEALLRDESACVLVTGEQGIGKSTLVEEFLSGLTRRNVRIVRGVITPFERDVPLGAMANFLTEMMRLGPRDDLRQLRDTLRMRVEALFPEEDDAELELLLHSLGSIFNVKYPGSSVRDLDGEERRSRKYLSVSKLLRRFAEKKPFILAVEDAHNLDESTLEFATQFLTLRQDVPAFFVATANPARVTDEQSAWQAFTEARRLTVEELGELNPEESRELIRDLLRVHGVFDEGLIEEVRLRSGGNPLFIKEVVEVLRDRGLLGDPEELKQLEVAEDNPSWLPASVEGLIGARIDRLDLALKVVVQKVSLLWTPFSVADAELVVGEAPVSELEKLVHLDLLERADRKDGSTAETYDPSAVPAEERSYRFANALTQEVASRSLLPEEAEALHLDIAEHLVARFNAHGLADNALIAKHFDGAGRIDEAIIYYKLAAEEALRDFGAAECLRLCGRVIERADPDSEDYYQALLLREVALYELGQVEPRRETLDELHDIVMRIGEPCEQIDVMLREARFFFDEADFSVAREHLDQARAIAERIDDQRRLADIWRNEVLILLNEGKRERAYELLEKAIDTYSRYDGDGEGGRGCEAEAVTEGLAHCHNLRGIVLRQSGRHLEALDAYEEALVHARRGDIGKQVRLLLINTGVALVYNGQLSEALERYESALEQCRRLGHRRDEASVLVNMGHAYVLCGELDRATSQIQRGIYLARKTGANAVIADGQISLGVCYLERGDLTAADQALHEGLRIADSIPNVYLSIHATLALAEVRLAAGTGDDARVALMQAEDGLERSRAAEMSWGIAYANALMARALKLLGRRDEAIEHSRRAIAILDDGEIFATDSILYHHTQLLSDADECREERLDAIERARRCVIERRERIDDPELRGSFMGRDINRKIMNVASLLIE
ncbi:MAG: protein kinase domain-containing protein [Persicimonas sp.]